MWSKSHITSVSGMITYIPATVMKMMRLLTCISSLPAAMLELTSTTKPVNATSGQIWRNSLTSFEVELDYPMAEFTYQ